MVDHSSAVRPPDAYDEAADDQRDREYLDELERALCEEPVAAIQHEPYECIGPDTSIEQAVRKLAGLHVACLLVAQDGELVGVFSDRDVLNKVALEFDALRDHPVREVMTAQPVSVRQSDCAAAALAVMVVAGYRHVPVLDVKGKLAGIVSPQRVAAFLAQHYAAD